MRAGLGAKTNAQAGGAHHAVDKHVRFGGLCNGGGCEHHSGQNQSGGDRCLQGGLLVGGIKTGSAHDCVDNDMPF